MSESNIVLPTLTSGQVMILWLVLVSALVALAYGVVLIRVVLAADPGPKSMTDVSDAIELGACRIINIKPGRVGGYLEARRIHDLCAERGVPVWMGGMLETGIGRAGNVAMAAMPNFTLPGDTSASGRYYHRDITAPFDLHDGRLDVPAGPGLGVEVDVEFLDSITHWKQTIGS